MKRNPKRCLRAYWGRDPDGPRGHKDLIIFHPTRSCDGALLAHILDGYRWPGEKTLREELEARGFDITTLRFSIQLKDNEPV